MDPDLTALADTPPRVAACSPAHDDDATWPVALCMSTHLAVSVHLRLEGEAGVEHRAVVIPRHACVGEQPRLRALLQGARALRMRVQHQRCASVAPQRVLVRVADCWVPLPAHGAA